MSVVWANYMSKFAHMYVYLCLVHQIQFLQCILTSSRDFVCNKPRP